MLILLEICNSDISGDKSELRHSDSSSTFQFTLFFWNKYIKKHPKLMMFFVVSDCTKHFLWGQIDLFFFFHFWQTEFFRGKIHFGSPNKPDLQVIPVPTSCSYISTKEPFTRRFTTCVPVFPGKAGTMPCTTTIFPTTAASRSLLWLRLAGAHYSKGCPLPEGLNWEREKDGKTKPK